MQSPLATKEHLHREAYNEVFAEFGLDTSWSKEPATQEMLGHIDRGARFFFHVLPRKVI